MTQTKTITKVDVVTKATAYTAIVATTMIIISILAGVFYFIYLQVNGQNNYNKNLEAAEESLK